jgi:adenosylcobyric acid synthase
MLGREIIDAEGIEGRAGRYPGLGLLDVVTQMHPQKTLALRDATYLATGDQVTGYEIHIGETDGPDCARSWLQIGVRAEGAASASGRVQGCYLHGLFASDGFRTAFLSKLGAEAGSLQFEDSVESTLDALAAHIDAALDVDRLLDSAKAV